MDYISSLQRHHHPIAPVRRWLAVARVTVRLLHIDQQDSPVFWVANELDLARVIAVAVTTTVVLFLGELANRLAAQLLESAADV